jgi:hypothetical protein
VLPETDILLDANAVRQISNGYVAIVADTPAVAPEINATAVGLELMA